MKAVIYARYSSDNQREESIEGQIRECTEYAEYNDIEIVGQYIDRAFSAKTDDRPDFLRMVNDSGKRLFDIVLVWKLDRFARNRYDSAFYRYSLRKNGVQVVSVKENISNGPEGIILEAMIEAMAEYYSANLAQNVKRGFKENALKGRWNGGAVPLGYKVVDHKLEIDETTAPLVYALFQMCADGYTAKEIYHYLQEKQIRRPNDKEIAYNSVLYLLSNRIYIGEYRHSGIVLEHGVPAIIPEEFFEKVQDNIKKHSIAPAAHSENDDYLLTTHLFCGHCGAMMTAYSGTSRTGKTYRYYICNRARKHLCEKEKAEKEKIENFVVYKTMELLQEDETIERLAQLLYTLQYEESTILPHLEEQLKEKEREINNIVTAIQKGAESDTLIARLTEIEQQKKALAEAITEEKKKSPVFTKDEFKMALCNFRKIDIGKLEGRRKLIDTFVNSVFLYDDHLKIIYNGKEKEEAISFEELESSKISQGGQPLLTLHRILRRRAFVLSVCRKKVRSAFVRGAPSLWVRQAFFGEKPGFAPNFSPKLAFPPRVCYNGGMERVNFHAQMLETLKTVPQGEKLLLHSCCGPCSSRCLEALKDAFAVTVFYYNPNITDAAEYAHRKSEQLRFLQETGWADFLDCDYAPQEFFSAAAGLEGEPEGGARCYECYRLRLERTARTAAERGFGWFCSTLSVSPHKNAAWLNEIGAALGQRYGVRWLYNDFKKQNGYLRSVRLAEEYGLYRQNYCGCIYSDWTKRPSDGKTK